MAAEDANIAHLEELACLSLDPAERQRLQGHLLRVLAYLDQLDAVDTAGVEVTCGLSADSTPLREDTAGSSLPVEEAVGTAPGQRDHHFTVPARSGQREDGDG